MQAADKYFSLLNDFCNTTLEHWYKELDNADVYIQKVKDEGGKTLHLEIKKNNALKRIEAIKNVFEAASEAINQANTKPTQTTLPFVEPQYTGTRKRIVDMPAYTNEVMLTKILNILENEFGN
jgi:hypothetical protein